MFMGPISPSGMTSLIQVLMVVLFGGGAGIPLGVPPRDPDPLLAKMAPEACLYYTTWAGMAKPDASSENQTEQLLAEPEVVAFVAELDRAIQAAAVKMSGNAGGNQAVIASAPLLAKTLITHPVALFVEHVAPRPNGLDVSGALVVNLGDDSEKVMRVVTRFLDSAPPSIVKKVTVEGVECTQLQPDRNAPVFTVGQKERYLIIAAGEGSFAGVLARAATPAPEWLTDGVAALKVPRPATFSYADVAAISKLVTQFAGPGVQPALDTLGLSSLTSAISVSGLDETGYVSRTKLVSSEPNRGLGALVGGEPLQAKELAGIPQDASIAVAVRFDLQRAVSEGLELLEEIEPNAAADVRRDLEIAQQQFGMDVEKDLLGALGDVWTLHTAPSGGGLLAGWTLTVDLKDAKKADAAHQKLLQFFKAAVGLRFNAPLLRSFEYGDQTAYSFEIPNRDVFVSPSWCLTDTHLVVTLLPQTLKSYLASAGAGQSLADRPAVAKFLGQENGPCAIAYQDVRSQFVTFYPVLQYATQIFARQLQREDFDIDTTALPSIDAIAPHLLPTIVAARKVDDGFESYVHTTLPGGNMGASAPVMVALLLPAVQASREASRRMQSTNNLKQIALAMHNYHDVYKSFPAAYNADAAGKPLLSWRVHILPFIEESQLYDQFHLDEPWNSQHNRTLIAKMPALYRAPGSKADPGKTVYLANAGKSGICLAPKKHDDAKTSAASGTRIAEIRDGTSNTVMAVEASDLAAVVWTKPGDLEFDADNPFNGLGGLRPGGFLAALCDGSVRFISRNVDTGILEALFTKDGGEMVGNF